MSQVPHLVDVKANARERLLRVAMRFFAERGVSGVSMSEIGMAAGNRNKSAVAYHFDNRAGLVNAIAGELHTFLQPRYDELLSALEARAPENVTIYEIGLALSAPIFALYMTEPDGKFAIRTLARLYQEPAGQIDDIYWNAVVHLFDRVAALIQRRLPDKSMAQLKVHFGHYLIATVAGFAGMATSNFTNFDYKADPEMLFELLLTYTDYVAGGLAARENGRPEIDVEYWTRAIQPHGGPVN
ncbi:MAG: TetR/AcrR family transcriptional regulator [Janthinobacterium lividum]